MQRNFLISPVFKTIIATAGDVEDVVLDTSPLQLQNHREAPRIMRVGAIDQWHRGHLNDAISQMTMYFENNSQDSTAIHFLGEWNYESGDLEKALSYWKLGGQSLLIQRAEEIAAQEEWNDLQQVMEVMEQTTCCPPTLFNFRRGSLYSLLHGQFVLDNESQQVAESCNFALEAYSMAVDESPELGFVRINYGIQLRECGYVNEAVATLDEIDATFSLGNQAWANHEIGLTYLASGEPKTALSYLHTANEQVAGTYHNTLLQTYQTLSVNEPANEHYQLELAKLYHALNDTERAMEIFLSLQDSQVEAIRKEVELQLQSIRRENR